MKTATIPAVRVEPALREELEALLREGESLSEFVEASVRSAIQRRRGQDEFIARGLASLEEARQTQGYVEADVVLTRLQARLERAQAQARRSTERDAPGESGKPGGA